MILEYLGVALAVTGQSIRSMFPKAVLTSFIFSGLAGVVLGTYTLLTHQYGLMSLNAWAITMSIVGMYKWKKYKIEKQNGKEGRNR